MIKLKNDYEYEQMKKAGAILANTMVLIASMIQPGMTMDKVDQKAYEYIMDHGAQPSFLGLYQYPYTICASLNNEVIHGFPIKQKILVEGDIISIDVGCSYNGYHADMAYTYPIGIVSEKRKKLLEVTKRCLRKAIDQAYCGSKLGNIGHAVQCMVEREGYSVVREYTGHGIGLSVHEEPQIPNFGELGKGFLLQAGMALAIEPMVNQGSYQVKTLDDQWTVVTADGSDSAHFEHTIFIKDSAVEILTECNKGGLA